METAIKTKIRGKRKQYGCLQVEQFSDKVNGLCTPQFNTAVYSNVDNGQQAKNGGFIPANGVASKEGETSQHKGNTG